MSTILKSNLQVYLNQLPNALETKYTNCPKITVVWYYGILSVMTGWCSSETSTIHSGGFGREYTSTVEAGNEILIFGNYSSVLDFYNNYYINVMGIPVDTVHNVMGVVGGDSPRHLIKSAGSGSETRCQPPRTNICLPIAYNNPNPSGVGSGDIINGNTQAEWLVGCDT